MNDKDKEKYINCCRTYSKLNIKLLNKFHKNIEKISEDYIDLLNRSFFYDCKNNDEFRNDVLLSQNKQQIIYSIKSMSLFDFEWKFCHSEELNLKELSDYILFDKDLDNGPIFDVIS